MTFAANVKDENGAAMGAEYSIEDPEAFDKVSHSNLLMLLYKSEKFERFDNLDVILVVSQLNRQSANTQRFSNSVLFQLFLN